MTPSLTSLADHVIWPISPPVTWLPCSPSPTVPMERCSYPLLPSPVLILPPLPSPMRSSPSEPTTTSLPPPSSDRVADDAIKGGDVNGDQFPASDIIRERCVKQHHTVVLPPICRCDNKLDHSSIVTAGASFSDTRGESHMGCVRNVTDCMVSDNNTSHDRGNCHSGSLRSASDNPCHCQSDEVSDSGSVTESWTDEARHVSYTVNNNNNNNNLVNNHDCHRLFSYQCDCDCVCDSPERVNTRPLERGNNTHLIPESVNNTHIPERVNTLTPESVNAHFLESVNNTHSPSNTLCVCGSTNNSHTQAYVISYRSVNKPSDNNVNTQSEEEDTNGDNIVQSHDTARVSDNVSVSVSDRRLTDNHHCRCHNHPRQDNLSDTTVTDRCSCTCRDTTTDNCDNVSKHLHSDNVKRLSNGGSGRELSRVESYDFWHWWGMATGLSVEWCRRCVKLPVVILVLFLLLLLPCRRKSRRREVIQVPRLSQVLFLLCLLLSHCLALPWIEEGARSVKLRARFCQPVPRRHLRSMLGEAFNPDHMSSDDPFAGKRAVDPSQYSSGMGDSALEPYYDYRGKESGPRVDESFVDLVRNLEEERREGEEEEWMREAMREKDIEVVVKRKDIMEEEDEEEKRGLKSEFSPYSQPYLNMKRRKRQAETREDFPSSQSSDDELFTKDKKSRGDPLLHLRLMLSSRNRKLRRKLKKEFRKKARKLARKPPPWTCSISKVWGRLKDGFFPRYLLDGRCLTDKCFYRLYDCVPQRYRIKLLKRDPDYCNPLPTVGVNTTYEQKWSVVRYYVTVGCNCEMADPLKVPLPFQGKITRS
ncbi:hypothetical protein ACOMHN_061274 [Nucella lapillus]